MDHHLPPLWPTTGDVVIITRVDGTGYEIAVCPDAAQIGCESYDKAWTLARTLAEKAGVDFWCSSPATAGRDADELRLLGHYRHGTRNLPSSPARARALH